MNIDVKATKREIGKKSDLNKMRRAGLIPAVIYSNGKPAVPVQIEGHGFLKEYRKSIGELVFFNILVDGQSYQTLIKEKQIHPVSRAILHLDFMLVEKDKKVTVDVPLRFVGTPIGAKDGGSLDIVLREIHVSCLPEDMPEDIEIDVSHLDVGHSIHVGDLSLGNLELHTATDITVAVVHPPKSVVDVDEAALTKETQPEGDEN